MVHCTGESMTFTAMSYSVNGVTTHLGWQPLMIVASVSVFVLDFLPLCFLFSTSICMRLMLLPQLHLLTCIHYNSCYVHSVFVGSSDVFVMCGVGEPCAHPNTTGSSFFTAPWP